MPAQHFAAPDPAGLEAWIRQLLRLTGAGASTPMTVAPTEPLNPFPPAEPDLHGRRRA